MRDWLKNIRLEKGLTQQQVAEQVGISTNYYSYIENGQRCEPSKNNTEMKIAETLGFDWKLFFEDDAPENTG